MHWTTFEIDRTTQNLSFLFEGEDPPEKLFIQAYDRNALALFEKSRDRGIGIVGTRTPTPRALGYLEQQIPFLKNKDLIIVSGFAKGIDQKCHRLALQNQIPTFAILGCGIDYDYPKNSQLLRETILKNGGLIVSEFDRMAPPLPGHFLKRNRLIAAWTKCVWVVESKVPSGTLNTAQWARKFERTCYVTPCFPGDSSMLGNQKLLDDFQATPYWGPHSFGSTWIEFSTLLLPEKKTKYTQLDLNLALLLEVIESKTIQSGSISIQKLIELLTQKNWSYNEIFLQIQIAKENGFLEFNQGLVEIKKF